ncbi:hypothetical protein [Viridibacillus arvi]|uniref:Uncharacterized protein n=1 Tax=Viridibacillus arvi TaxID=263475 RepID=A0A0M0LKU1_9BACL|nr:hypothetical protein [Viridibacillus arvi]KOO51502.1 hypothetical protein AMD00_03255 [Viridibacillus arvi]
MSKIVPYMLNPFCITIVVVLIILFGNQALGKYANKSYPLAIVFLILMIACITFVFFLIKAFRLKAKTREVENE